MRWKEQTGKPEVIRATSAGRVGGKAATGPVWFGPCRRRTEPACHRKGAGWWEWILREPRKRDGSVGDGGADRPRPPTGCCATPKGVALSDPEGKDEMEKVVTISLTGDRRLRPRTVLGWEYRFVNDAEIEEKRLVGTKEKPVQWKVIEMEIAPNELVWVSDPEWTILCGLGRPDLCGGVAAVARGLERWRERIDLMKLMRYAMQIRNRTAVRRLGYLMDVLGIHTEKTQLWLGLAVFKHYGRLEPGRPWKGDLERKWRVDVNGEIGSNPKLLP